MKVIQSVKQGNAIKINLNCKKKKSMKVITCKLGFIKFLFSMQMDWAERPYSKKKFIWE